MAILGNPTKYQSFPVFVGEGNGVDTSFNLGFIPGSVNNLDVWVGGAIQSGTFQVVGTNIVFDSAPEVGERILVKSKGIRSVSVPMYRVERLRISPTVSQTVFSTLPYSYVTGTNQISVYVNGVKWGLGDDYLETSSNTITLVDPHTFEVGDVVELEITSVS